MSVGLPRSHCRFSCIAITNCVYAWLDLFNSYPSMNSAGEWSNEVERAAVERGLVNWNWMRRWACVQRRVWSLERDVMYCDCAVEQLSPIAINEPCRRIVPRSCSRSRISLAGGVTVALRSNSSQLSAINLTQTDWPIYRGFSLSTGSQRHYPHTMTIGASELPVGVDEWYA